MEKNNIKPGYKTTEAWASLLASIFMMINLPVEQASLFVGGLTGLYTLGRSFVKSFQDRPFRNGE